MNATWGCIVHCVLCGSFVVLVNIEAWEQGYRTPVGTHDPTFPIFILFHTSQIYPCWVSGILITNHARPNTFQLVYRSLKTKETHQPSLFQSLPLLFFGLCSVILSIILNVNQKTKTGEAWQPGYTSDCRVLTSLKSHALANVSSHTAWQWGLKCLLVACSLVPRPPPSFPSLYCTSSDGKLGKGLGTRLSSLMAMDPFAQKQAA